MSRVLLVEDHDRLAELIRRGLAGAGIAADVVARADAAWYALQQAAYDALVLDRGLPDGDGLSMLRRLRASKHGVPCLVLTARDALHDRIEGLDAGADDYLPKPFEMDELIARVRALLRRPVAQCVLEPQLGDLRLSPPNASLHCGGVSVTLAPAELQIMQTLMLAQGQTVRRGALESAAWGWNGAVTPNALDVALHRLRRKLQALGSQQGILNARNLGYAIRTACLPE